MAGRRRVRDQLLGRPVDRRRRRRSRATRARRRGRSRARRARPRLPALGGVRRLARDRPRRPAASTTWRRFRARRSRRTSRARDFTINAMAAARRLRRGRRPTAADRPARRPRRPRGAHAARDRRRGLRGRSAARAAARSPRRRARLRRPTPRPSGSRARRRRAWPRPPASASSPSCAGSSLAPSVIGGLELADRLGLPARGRCPSWPRCTTSSRASTTTADVYGHTLEVLERLLELEAQAPKDGSRGACLDEPLGRRAHARGGAALRRAAPRHRQAGDARRARLTGRVTFMGHDRLGEQMVHDLCRRLRTSERFSRFVEALTRHHLRARLPRPRAAARPPRRLPLPAPHRAGGGRGDAALLRRPARDPRPQRRRGDRRPPGARARADGGGARLARAGPPAPLVRGDELARELGIEPGPELGSAARRRSRRPPTPARLATREDALRLARAVRENPAR